MPDFSFDPKLSSSANIDKYFTHLESIDAELAQALKQHIGLVCPIPESPADKQAARKRFSEKILEILEVEQSAEETD